MRGVGTAYRYESLLDGTLTLVDIARVHDWMDVKLENERLWQEKQPHG